MKWFNEKEFEHAGLKCVCVATNGGWRCGYVGVTAEHPKHGADYDDVDVDVHGGLTFASGKESVLLTGNRWWFGFDCNHCDDCIDKTLLDDETKRSFGMMADFGGSVRNLDYVENECKRLAEQLDMMKGQTT